MWVLTLLPELLLHLVIQFGGSYSLAAWFRKILQWPPTRCPQTHVEVLLQEACHSIWWVPRINTGIELHQLQCLCLLQELDSILVFLTRSLACDGGRTTGCIIYLTTSSCRRLFARSSAAVRSVVYRSDGADRKLPNPEMGNTGGKGKKGAGG